MSGIERSSKGIACAFFLMLAFGGLAHAGEVIGGLSDPCDPAIPAAVDITSAWVEKTGATLDFVIAARGPIPAAVTDPCSMTYIWFTDADNNPQTGQDPGGVGSEFNVRAVIRVQREGWVDVTGAMPGGGQGAVSVDGNQIRLTIELALINSPDLFHFRCIAARNDGTFEQGNGVTAESAQCWVSQHAVLYPSEPISYYGLDQSAAINLCDQGDPFNPDAAYQAENKAEQFNDNYPQYNSIMALAPASEGGREYAMHTVASADFQHLRNLSYIDLDCAAGAFGGMRTKSTAGAPFKLIAKSGRTGLVPPNLFALNICHDYHLRASASASNAYGNTYAQIVITDIDDPGFSQKFLWPDDRFVFMDKFSAARRQRFDLADFGLKFENTYMLDLALIDGITVEVPSEAAEVAADTTLAASLGVTLAGDIDENRSVDFLDFAVFAEAWLEEK